eukprot:scaffold84711_cov50-Phaeocystis_antarctica.AAC.3
MPSRKAAAPAVKPSLRRPTDRPQERIPCGPAKLAPPPKGARGARGAAFAAARPSARLSARPSARARAPKRRRAEARAAAAGG